jgi:hypothetical protein
MTVASGFLKLEDAQAIRDGKKKKQNYLKIEIII